MGLLPSICITPWLTEFTELDVLQELSCPLSMSLLGADVSVSLITGSTTEASSTIGLISSTFLLVSSVTASSLISVFISSFLTLSPFVVAKSAESLFSSSILDFFNSL